MLNVPKLDDLDYDRIFARARSRIPTLTDEWTNFNDADPGITMLQTFAWLYDGLNYYLDATGDVHRLKYFKLLGIRPQQSPAQAVIAFEGEGELCVPEGMRFAAQDVPFEAAEDFCAPANRMCRLYVQTDGTVRELTDLAGADGGYAPLFTLEKGRESCAWFGFERPLSGAVRLFVPVQPTGRNAFGDTFSLAELQWEWYDGKAWREAAQTADETCGLLRSGFVALALDGETQSYGGEAIAPAHYLRCRLVRSEYDELPRVGRLLPCCVRAVQQHTWACAAQYAADGTDVLTPRICVRGDDLLSVAVDEGGSGEYTEWFCHEPNELDLCEVEVGGKPWQRRIRFDAKKFGRAPQKGDGVAVLLLSGAAADDAFLGMTDGCAGQRLAFHAKNISALTLALVTKGGEGRRHFTLWHRCRDLAEAGCDERVFVLDEAGQSVQFGDSIHGVEPEAGAEVWAVEIRTSLFGAGNVRAGQIGADGEVPEGADAVWNPADAQGGRDPSTMEELAAEMEKRMSAVTRAVTAQDYAALVKATPGLRIDSVTVVSSRDYNAAYRCGEGANTVFVAVKPFSSYEKLPVLSEPYRRAIAAHLEHCRLLTTDIRVISARYLGIAVYGRILLTENSPALRARIEQELASLVDTVRTGEYGRKVDYGRVFAALELLEGVRSVAQLSFEYVGEGGKKNEHGDILAGPDTLTYLRETGLEFV